MSTGKDPGRLTRADERAIAKALADADQEQVDVLAHLISRYEATAEDAKARLGKSKVWTTTDLWWHGGYRAAMSAVRCAASEMRGTGHSTRDVLAAVLALAEAAQDLASAESTVQKWAGDAP